MIGHHVRRYLAQREHMRLEAQRTSPTMSTQSFAYFCAQQKYRIKSLFVRRARQRRGLTTRGGHQVHMTQDVCDTSNWPLCELHLTKRGYSG